MADVVKNKKTLTLVNKFSDGDSRTITLDDPNTSLNLGAKLASISSFMRENNLIIGDKEGADFVNIESAKVQQQKITYLDLNS